MKRKHQHISADNLVRNRPVFSADNIVKSNIPDLTIPKDLPFHEFVFEKCDQFKNNVALEEFLSGKTCTYGQLKASSLRVASGLHKHGLRKGDVALIFSTNCIEFAVLMLACARIGVCISPANPIFTPGELCLQLSNGGATAVFTSESLADIATKAMEKKTFEHVTHRFVFGEAPGFDNFHRLLEDNGSSLPVVNFDPVNDMLTMPYSSGTTGLPKGVMLTHYNCLANVLQSAGGLDIKESDVALGLLPLYHIYGMMVIQYGVLNVGGTVIYMPKFEPDTFLRCIQDKKITLAFLVPPLVVFMAKHPMCANFDLTSVSRVFCGAAPLGADITIEFKEKYDHVHRFCQGYGLTETSPLTNLDTTQTIGCAGSMVANTVGKIVDIETGKTLGPHQDGEVCVKGPQVMKGYFNNKKATDGMLDVDGWMSTGDIGYFDEEGKLYIKDRLKELIKYKGSQVNNDHTYEYI